MSSQGWLCHVVTCMLQKVVGEQGRPLYHQNVIAEPTQVEGREGTCSAVSCRRGCTCQGGENTRCRLFICITRPGSQAGTSKLKRMVLYIEPGQLHGLWVPCEWKLKSVNVASSLSESRG